MEIDARDFLRSLQDAVRRTVDRAGENHRRLGDHMKRQAQARTPVDSGEMKSKWQGRWKRTFDGFEYELVNTADHALAVEFGDPNTPPRAPLRQAKAAARQSSPQILKRGL